MPKTKLWTTNFTDGELDVRQDVYTVSETGWGISVTQPGGGWHGLNSWLYARMFGDTPHSVIANRRKWLIEDVLPRKMEELKSVTDEINAMSIWLNNNQ